MQNQRTNTNEFELSVNMTQSDIEAEILPNIPIYQPTRTPAVLQSINNEPSEQGTPSSSRALSSATNKPKLRAKPSIRFEDLKFFPFLKDQDLRNVTVTYFLYLGFFHISIRIFFALLLFSITSYLSYTIAADYDPSLYTPYLLVLMYSLFILSAGFLLRFIRGTEEYKLIHHEALEKLPWTEDLFSLLVEGIPIDIRKTEVTVFFNKLLSSKNVSGCVKSILFVQDYYEYTQVKKQISQIDQELEKRRKKGPIEEQTELRLLTKKSQLSGLLGQLEAKIINLECFKGKAIVIFDSIQAKSAVASHFSVPFYRKPFTYCFPALLKKHYFNASILSVTQPPEPQDLIFENLYYPQRRRILFRVLAYLISLLLTFSVIISLLALNGIKVMSKANVAYTDIAEIMTSYGFIIGILVLGFVLRKSYKCINSGLIYPSALESQVDTINFSIYTSFLLYVPTQIVPIYFNPDLWADQLMKIIILYFLERIIVKIIENRFNEKSKNETTTGLEASLTGSSKQENDTDFDLVEGVNSAIPLIFMAFTSLFLGRFSLLAIIIISLYIMAGIDKYWLIKGPEFFKSKSPSYMLKAFRVFQWDSLCFFGASLLMFLSYRNSTDFQDWSDLRLNWVLIIAVLLVILAIYFCCSKSLSTQIKERFFYKNAQIKYEAVKEQFPSTYHAQDPWKQITT